MSNRRKFIALGAVLALSLSASACASFDWAPSGGKPAPLTCYWMTPDGSRWEARADAATKEECFALDSCSGGLGRSGGGCYKWARGADQPGVKW
jgi:hypothetical protein